MRFLSKPSDPHGRNSPNQSVFDLRCAIGPLESSEIEMLSIELGAGTSPQALNSEVISTQSNSVLSVFEPVLSISEANPEGASILQDSADNGPLPENSSVSNPRGAISLFSI